MPVRVAANEYRCFACGEPIHRGQEHHYSAGNGQTYRRHLTCYHPREYSPPIPSDTVIELLEKRGPMFSDEMADALDIDQHRASVLIRRAIIQGYPIRRVRIYYLRSMIAFLPDDAMAAYNRCCMRAREMGGVTHGSKVPYKLFEQAMR